MKVRKENRVLTVDEADKAFYLSEGYDVVEVENGEYVISEKATGGRTFTIAEYSKLESEIDALKAENTSLKANIKKLKTEKDKTGKSEKAEKQLVFLQKGGHLLIIDLDTARLFKVDVTQEELDGLEVAIRNYTNNNFQVRTIRLEDVVFTSSTITSPDSALGFKKGSTVQVSNDKYNDGLYFIEAVEDNGLTFETDSFIPHKATDTLVTLVKYPADILFGVQKLLKYSAKMDDKIGVKSESISRMSKTYYDVNATENIEGYPAALMTFLNKYKKLRWS